MACKYSTSPPKEVSLSYLSYKKNLSHIEEGVKYAKSLCLPNMYSSPTAYDVCFKMGDNFAYIKDNILFVNVFKDFFLKVEISSICLIPTNSLILKSDPNIFIDFRNKKIRNKGIYFSFDDIEKNIRNQSLTELF